MTSKEELLKRFKEERIAREKARIQMLHDLNIKKYSKSDDNARRYFKPNRSFNKSYDISPVKNGKAQTGPIFANNVHSQIRARPRVKKFFRLHSFGDNYLNVSAPINSNSTFSEDLAPKRKSMHDTGVEHRTSVDHSSQTPTNDVK